MIRKVEPAFVTDADVGDTVRLEGLVTVINDGTDMLIKTLSVAPPFFFMYIVVLSE